MDSDRQLLKQFTQHNSEPAFAALTARYLSLVYSTCRRELDDASLAEDVTQAVFLILARKAPSLRREVVLSGWLFQTARFAARNARLQETRRKATEEIAAETLREQQMNTEDAAWAEIEPLLNQSLAALRDAERECVLLRFFQGMTFAEAGASLGMSEEAARKRVSRGLNKMRQVFIKNGVIVPAAALAALLTTHAAKAAPVGLAPAIARSTAGVVAGHINAGLTIPHVYKLSEGVVKAMKIAQVKVVVGITTVAIIGLGSYAGSHAMTAAAHPAALLLNVPKQGHVLQQVPGKTLTASQIVAHCRAAYAALNSYQGTATSVIEVPKNPDRTSTAHILFVRPHKIAVDGTDMDGRAFAYVSDGLAVADKNSFPTDGSARPLNWKEVPSLSLELGMVGGETQLSAVTVPALLLQTKPLDFSVADYPFNDLTNEVREITVDGHPCYIVTATTTSTTGSDSRSFWVDAKSFLLRRYNIDSVISPKTKTVLLNGKPFHLVDIRIRIEQHFTNERINQPIPDSVFALPPMQ